VLDELASRSSALGVRIEAPKEVWVGRGVPFPTERKDLGKGGAENIAFGSQNGEFLCILSRIFTVF